MNHPRHAPDFHRHDRREAVRADQSSDMTGISPRTVTSQSLFMGDHEIGIEHHGSLYRLKITRQGKLILNK